VVADDRRAADALRDEATEGHLRVQAIELQAVQCRHRAQFCVPFEDKVAEKAQVQAALRRLAEQLAQRRRLCS
jgi:hypothetical protein